MSSTEKAITSYKTIQQIVEQLEKCNYTTKDNDHDLKNNVAFLALKRMAEDEQEIRDMLDKINMETPLIAPEDNTINEALKFILDADNKFDKNWSKNTMELAKVLVGYANKFLI